MTSSIYLPVGVATLAALLVGAAGQDRGGRVEQPVRQAVQAETRNTPPLPWAQQDPADSLYRAAREALNAGDFRRAATTFLNIVERFPKSSYASDALYWAAYADYRMGGSDDLKRALEALQRQRTEYPQARTRGDAEALAVRIQGQLARSGDADAAAAVAQRMDEFRQTEASAEAREQAREQADAAREQSRAGREAARAEVEAARARGDTRRNQLPPGCEDQKDEFEIRSAALNALMQMDADRALPVLKQVIANRDPCNAPLRRTALFLVGQSDSPEATQVLLDAVRTDPDPDVRKQAVFFLSQVDAPQAVPALEEILRTSKDEEMQGAALFALSQTDSPRSGEILRSYAGRDDISADLRGKAIFFLSQQDSDQNAQFLRELFGRTQDEQVRERILFSVSQMGGAGNGQWLLDLALNDRYPVELRKKALFFAGQEDDALPVEGLAQLYDRMPDTEMRKQLIFVLSQRDDKAAVDKMIDIARTEKDPELRKSAIFWLGQSDDPRAVQVLQEIINHD